VSYRVKVWGIGHTFSIDLGCKLELEGPPTSGRIVVDWSIISFTIPFGHSQKVPEKLGWDEFVSSFLPTAVAPPSGYLVDGPNPYVSITVSEGLLENIGTPTGTWRLDPDHLVLVTNAVIPSTAINLNGAPVTLIDEHGAPVTPPPLGIVPMQAPALASGHNLTWTGTHGPVVLDNLRFVTRVASVAPAVWGTAPPVARSATIPGVPVGLEIVGDARVVDAQAPFAVSNFGIASTSRTLTAHPVTPPTSPSYPQGGSTLLDAMKDPAVLARRAALVAALAQTSGQLPATVATPVKAASAADVLDAAPGYFQLGEVQAAATGASDGR
jgi:hypothetical protein